MAHLQYLPGDPRLVDQLVYELKSKGIFDQDDTWFVDTGVKKTCLVQKVLYNFKGGKWRRWKGAIRPDTLQFRKDCIADVDTRPAYQNLRQRVESSVASFLSRQVWKPELNKNQLREKLRKHILDGNYLEQGVERIVDQVVNPKVASVFIPQVEDLVYNYLGITKKKSVVADNLKEDSVDLLLTDLEAVSPGSVKSNAGKEQEMDTNHAEKEEINMDVEQDDSKMLVIDETTSVINTVNIRADEQESQMSTTDFIIQDSCNSIDISSIPLPAEGIRLENIPVPENSPPKDTKVELENIALPKELNVSTDIPLPDEIYSGDKTYFKPIEVQSEEDSSSDSSLRRNMSPLTPIRNFNNENSCDAQQAFEDESSQNKNEGNKDINSFKFNIDPKSVENSLDGAKDRKKDAEQSNLTYQFANQMNINSFNTPLYEDSSNSNNLQIDYESDANSKTNISEIKQPIAGSKTEDTKKEQKSDAKRSAHKSSHRSRDSHRQSSGSKDRRSNSRHSSSKDRKDSKYGKKPYKEDSGKSRSSQRERSKDRHDKKDSRDSSKHRSSSHKISREKDSKSHRSSSSSKQTSKTDEKRSSSSSHRDKNDKSSDKSSRDRSTKDTKSSSSRSEKDKRSVSSTKSKPDEKDKEKKDKKDADDHYSLSGRGNHHRRSTDRDSNDGSSSSKGSNNHKSSKSSESKRNSKSSNSKSVHTSSSGSTSSPSDKDVIVTNSALRGLTQYKAIVRIENHLEIPIASPPRLPFVPDITLRKPKIAANFEEAKKLMKMRKFLDEEQKRMNQEAALLLEFQANVRPSLSQVYSSIPGPELEFACVVNNENRGVMVVAENNSTEPLVVDMKNIGSSSENLSPNSELLESEPSCESVEETENTVEETITTIKETNIVKEKISSIEELKRTNNYVINNIKETAVSNDNKEVFEPLPESIVSNVTNDLFEKFVSNAVNHEIEIIEPVLFCRSQNNDVENNNIEINEIVEGNNITPKFKEANHEIEIIKPVLFCNGQSNETNSINDESDDIKINQTVVQNDTIKGVSKPLAMDDIVNNTTLKTKEAISNVGISEPLIVIDDVESDTNPKVKETVSNIVDVSEPITIIDDEDVDIKRTEYFEVTIITEELSEDEDTRLHIKPLVNIFVHPEESELKFFYEQDKFIAEIERDHFCEFLEEFTEKVCIKNKINLINCDSLGEKAIKEASEKLGDYEIVNYHKNGYLKAKNVVKNVNVSAEVTLPLDKSDEIKEDTQVLLSPVKSDYSFELSSDYDDKIEEMVNKASRQQIMEIILGGSDETPTELPRIDYCMESNIDECSLKRKINEVDSSDNNNENVLSPKKIRKMSGSDQISSTTQESEDTVNNKIPNNTRSKYLIRARRIGLPRPKKSNVTKSPSSDKSVENYLQNSKMSKTPNGKVKTPRNKVQRYDTSDLYKPKLHYLSRRNNIS